MYLAPQHGAHRKKTEAEFVERIGDKTRIIKHSHNYTTTGQRHRTLDQRHPDLGFEDHIRSGRRRGVDIPPEESSSEDELISDISFPFSFSLPQYGTDADKTTVQENLRVTSQSPQRAAREWAYTEHIYNITHSRYVRGNHAGDTAIADMFLEKALRDTEKASLPLLRWM